MVRFFAGASCSVSRDTYMAILPVVWAQMNSPLVRSCLEDQANLESRVVTTLSVAFSNHVYFLRLITLLLSPLILPGSQGAVGNSYVLCMWLPYCPSALYLNPKPEASTQRAGNRKTPEPRPSNIP